jgi:HlyD family secretion protein
MNRFLLSIIILLITGCKQPVKATKVEVQYGSIEESVSSITSGTVKAEKVTDLAFGTVGRVATLNVKLGDKVTENQILAELENSDWRTALEVAEREYQRATELYKSNITAKQDLDRAKEKRDSVAMSLEKSLIKAPFTGVITEMNLEIGQLSQITAVMPKPLIRLIDSKPRYVRAEIDEVDLGRVKMGMPARVKVLASRKEPYNAKVRKIVPAVNSIREQDRTATIELEIESDELLPDGASADVEIITQKIENVLLTPSRAVIGRKGAYFVFVSENSRAKKKEIQIGIRGYDYTEIKNGLREKEVVLIPSDLSEIEEGKLVTE